MNAPAARVVIERGHGAAFGLRELWAFRELLYFVAWRDVKVRYKQTLLGAAWAVIQPLSAMLVFSVIFGRLAAIPSDGVPYPLFAYTALVPWTFFVNGFTQATKSLVSGADLIRKVYFPRLVIPISSVMSGVVDFAVSSLLLVALTAYYGVVPSARLVWLPAVLLLLLVSTLAVGICAAALNVEFRDVGYITPFLGQLWLFVTPVLYPASLVPAPWRTLLGLNPMAGVSEAMRWTLLGTSTDPWPIVTVSAVVASSALVGGVVYFRRFEARFADVI